MKSQLHIALLLIIILLGSFLRLYLLDSVPPGFNQDEASIGYNAYSILQTGKDEYGRDYPVYFKAFGDQKLPVYVYATVLSEKIFGVNEFAVRLPSAFFGILCLPLFYFVIRIFTKKKELALVATFLLAINPWSLHYNRSAFEVSISLCLFLAGVLALYSGFVKNKHGGILLGTLFFLLSLYSYNLTRLLSPILYIFVVYWLGRNTLFKKKIEIGITLLLSGIMLLPFFILFFSSAGVDSAGGTLIFTSSRFQAPLLELRTFLVTLPTLFTKIFFNMQTLLLWEYLRNILSYLSVSFLFLVGENHGNHGIGNVGQFYVFELPFMLYGFWRVITKKDKTGYFFLIWGIISILVASLTREAPQATRSYFALISYQYFSAVGLYYLIQKMWQLSSLKRLTVLGVCLLFILYNLIYYFTSYYYRFPNYYAKAWRSEDKKVSIFLSESAHKKIIIDKESGFSYASFLFFSRYSPSEFQHTSRRLPDDSEGFSQVTSFGNVSFEELNEKSVFLHGTVIITNKDKLFRHAKLVKTLYYPERTIVAADGQKLLQYPTNDVAYVIFEAK